MPGEGVQDFLKIFVAPGEPDKNALLLARTRLASLLGFRFPAPLGDSQREGLPFHHCRSSRR